MKALRLLGLIVGAVLLWAIFVWFVPAQATTDPRCELDRWKDRPICQTTEPPVTTTTTTIPEPSTSTSTTLITTTTSPTVPSLGTAIAGVGCSNTKDAIEGYLDQSQEDNIILVAAGGHTIETWAENTQSSRKDPWGRYLSMRPTDGYDSVWLQLCERVGQLTTENVMAILTELVWANDPGIPVWISPMNYYETETCSVTGGNQIPNEGAVIANELSATIENVIRGPDLGPLSDSQVRLDDCHPNDAGVELLGNQLKDFFDE